ncbi:uncharacterized protein GGS25DRAFT_208998 [Hypoxylon fragiforme]|uniref:uncharacterized protein n=1 Tax=Hypoxylon fragiforme TaxID=63214 RepID=UPI0020C69692|nr:uncharacterized protein GGS25DRAFT_208998 [Hypoxylon fragiforme]KAI2611758.1 hypothetical protein GGS25DRAFT_208998 [Hypoxylon fragiforme]
MEDDEDMTAAMAQAMGFSSFGAQDNPSKRRKFNPRADAVVDSDTISGISYREAASGSNTTPLGTRSSNQDEINLESDEDAVIIPGGSGSDGIKDSHGGQEPQSLESLRLPGKVSMDGSVDKVQSRIDDIVGDIPSHPLPTRPSSLNGGRGGNNRRGNNRGGRHNNRGGHEPGRIWWEDYYDPSSNINPWEQLEVSMGLKAQGEWMTWEEAKAGRPSQAGASSLPPSS